MDLYEKIVKGEEKLSLVGLGYVGMPIAVAFARKIKVVGFDLNELLFFLLFFYDLSCKDPVHFVHIGFRYQFPVKFRFHFLSGRFAHSHAFLIRKRKELTHGLYEFIRFPGRKLKTRD